MTSYSDLVAARANMWRHQERLKCFPDVNIVINDEFIFNLARPECGVAMIDVPEPYLKCYLSPGLLDKILHRKFHWNDAELGCHIEFDRRPNVFSLDTHTLMCFFHV